VQQRQGSASWNEACQFDQHCVGNACVAFGPTESGSCNGIDITAPTTCIPSTGSFRDVTVCNRGTVAAPPGISAIAIPEARRSTRTTTLESATWS